MNTARSIEILHAELDEAIDAILEKHGQKKLSSRVRYSENSFNLSLKVISNEIPDTPADELSLRAGLSKPGTIAYVNHKGQLEKVRILSKARTKYNFEFVDNPSLNRSGTWKGSFYGFKAKA